MGRGLGVGPHLPVHGVGVGVGVGVGASGLSRAMRLRGWPPMNWKAPPTRILPSACIVRAKTKSFALGSKLASSEPSELSRAMPL